MPRAITDKSFARSDLRRVVDRVLPMLERLERICRPRFQIFAAPLPRVLVGLVVLVLGVIMILPIPLIGNMPPGAAAAVIAVGVTERDGVVVLVGLVGATAAIVVAGAATWAILLAIVHYFMKHGAVRRDPRRSTLPFSRPRATAARRPLFRLRASLAPGRRLGTRVPRRADMPTRRSSCGADRPTRSE
jgi:hypothetical protein